MNPVQSGGGVKTKMVEAIAFGTTVISTNTGATGINKISTGNKLISTNDNDWHEFVRSIISNADKNAITPPEYYDHYFWGNVIKNMIRSLSDQTAGQTKNY